MSAVKKWYIGVYGGEAQARPCSPAKFEVIRDRDRRYFVVEDDFDRVTAERDAALEEALLLKKGGQLLVGDRNELQQRLTAADERVDRLKGLWLEWVSCTGQVQNLEEFSDRVAAELAGLPPATCTWSRDQEGIWNSACGTAWTFHDDGPAENGMQFCHSCGNALVVEPAEGGGDEN